MPSNTTTVCTQVVQFSSETVVYDQRGMTGVGSNSVVSNIMLKLNDDSFLTGGTLLVKGATFGDYADMQVVDVDNILGYGANMVLRQFVTAYYMDDTQVNQGNFDLPYPAKVITGLYMRLVYHSTGTNDVQIACNFSFHKILR